MTTRRRFLQSASATGLMLALSGRGASGQVPSMTKEARRGITPDQALALLEEGNARFVTGKMLERDLMAQVRATASGQYPFAGVLGCIDSRVPPELVFDQGIGDIFSARVAGNFVNTDFIGSFEFATKIAGAKLIVVLGHTECGAIKGACDSAQFGNLTSTLSNIMPAVYAVNGVPGERTSKNSAFVQEVARENVRLNVKALTVRSAVLHDLVETGQIKVVGAMHDVATGRVSLLS
jgi:carbonic anhydrase